MEKVILIRFGEIFLKGNNKGHFESLLKKNIKSALAGYGYKFYYSQNRYYVEQYAEEDEQAILDALLKVFGLFSISPALKVKNVLEDIAEVAVSLAPDEGTFRMTVNRADKSFPLNSMQLAQELGGCVLDAKPNLTVELFRPQCEIKVDLRENGYCYVYRDTLRCAGGLPVGSSGGGMLLLSGGIDSPVAGYMMAKRGMRLTALHFHSEPYTNGLARDKVIRNSAKISQYCLPFDLLVVPLTDIQREIHEKCPAELMVTFTRRFMMRIAVALAKERGLGAIITGESLGQVASQTVESMTCTNALADMPIFRPLIGFDKTDIIAVAQKIDTYDTSIEPSQDCCTVFLPHNPAIHPKLPTVERFEKALDVEALVADAISRLEIVKISPKM